MALIAPLLGPLAGAALIHVAPWQSMFVLFAALAAIARTPLDNIAAWAAAKPDGAIFKQAPAADHGAAPFALIPDILRHASGAEA